MAERLADDMSELLQVRVTEDGGTCVAQLIGELDVSTSELLRSELQSVVENGCRSLTVDMAELALIDSTGLGVLVGILKRVLRQGGEMRMRAPRSSARKVFAITGLDRVFTIVD